MSIDFRVLGPLDVVEDGVSLRLGGPRTRALLAALLVETDLFVSRDRLIDELWGDDPPVTAENALQAQVAALRRLLPGRIVTDGTAYRLAASSDEIDARRFEMAVEEARAMLERHPAMAAARLAKALAAWRGPALDGAATGRIAGAEATRLDSLRRAAQVARADGCLALGENDTVVAELTGLVAGDATDERLAGRLMLAQYRSSGSSDALATFDRVRAGLESELATEPDSALLELRSAIERRDPTLAGPTAGLPVPTTRFVGRERDLREASDLLGTSRLLTLVGPGGSGKSRLCLELARSLTIGRLAEVHLVSLATLPPGGSVTRLIAAAFDVRERRGEPLVAAILSRLRNRRSLLLLDNCEHVLPMVAGLVAELLAGAPGLRILATSREPLGAPGESPGPSPASSFQLRVSPLPRCWRRIRCSCYPTVRSRHGPGSSCPGLRLPARWRFVAGSTVSRSPSNWWRRAFGVSRWRRSWSCWRVALTFRPVRLRRPLSVIGRSARRSTGATTCWRRASVGCFAAWRCSAAAWTLPRHSPCGATCCRATTRSHL